MVLRVTLPDARCLAFPQLFALRCVSHSSATVSVFRPGVQNAVVVRGTISVQTGSGVSSECRVSFFFLMMLPWIRGRRSP